MPLYDYECRECGQVSEIIVAADDKRLQNCFKCGKSSCAARIISVGSTYIGNQDATWLKCVPNVVGNDLPEEREFKRNPTRDNYRSFMRARNLRPFEPGEKPGRPAPVDTDALTRRLAEKHRKRKAVEVR